MFTITKHEFGPRLYIYGYRWHHGMTGIVGASICTAIKQRKLALIFVGLILHDIKDFPFTDKCNH
jgi:hypothetical protein